MRKVILSIMVFVAQINFAQNTFPTPSGNVGIGTTSPTSPLEIKELNESKPQGVLSPTKSVLKLSRAGSTNYTYNENAEFRIGHGGPEFWGSKLDLYINSGSNINSVPDQHVMTWNYNGNVGIGTDTPFSKLSVVGSLTLNGGLNNTLSRPVVSFGTLANGEIRSYSSTGNNYDDGFLRLSAGGGTTSGIKSYIDLSGYSTVPDMDRNILFGTGGTERMRIDQYGNISVGTSNVGGQTKFHVKESGTSTNIWRGRIVSSGDLNAVVMGENNGKSCLGAHNSQLTAWSDLIIQGGGGNVGIGIFNPQNKLDVNGTIHSKEVKVDMIGWSDFVFKKEYTLPTLEEVEKHITEKGHLENIPSEEEVLKNGISLGEMNAKLLQKIEELTLYMIELKKENSEMKKDILKLIQHNKE